MAEDAVPGACGGGARRAASGSARDPTRRAAAPDVAAVETIDGDAEAMRDRVQRVVTALGEVSGDLACAMSSTKAAELLALRGGSFHPSMRLLGNSQLGERHLAERNAGNKLPDAGKYAQDAYTSVCWCRSHLHTVLLLLEHKGVPDVNVFIDEERIVAVGDLADAIARVELSAGKAASARQDVPGGGGH